MRSVARVVKVCLLSAVDGGHRVGESVQLNVALLSGPNVIDSVRFSEEKRSGFRGIAFRLGNQSERLQAPNRRILRLDLEGVDVLLFDAVVASGRLSDLQQAVALYRRPLLEGCQAEGAFQERNMREQSCLQALRKLGDAALGPASSASRV